MLFYILGDMGSGDDSQKQVAKALSNKIGNKKTFVCGLGDNIYEHGVTSVDDEQFIKKFEEPYHQINNNVEFWMCLGNHDYGYSNLSLDPVRNAQYQIEYTKKSKKWKLPNNYYNFKKDNVEFIVIDTNFEHMDINQIKKQLKWAKNRIKKSKCKWKIVYGHHTFRSIAGHGNAEDDLESFLTELFTESPFDIYMCGHDHNKQLINFRINNKPLTLIVCGTGGKVYHDISDYSRMDENCDLCFVSQNLGYGSINALKNKLMISFFDENNNLEYQHEITK